MSLLVHAAATVAATPSPSPEVINKTIVQPIAQTPAAVIQLFQLLGLAAAGVVTSVLHWLANRDKWSSNVNRLVWALYSLVGGLAYAFFTGHLGSSATDLASAFIGTLGMGGSSSAFYNLVQFLNQVLENANTAPTTAGASQTAASS